MFNAYTPAHNAGRFGTEAYGLARLVELRNRLAGGLVPGQVILVSGNKVLLDDGIDHLTSIIAKNRNDSGKPSPVMGVSADVIIQRLDTLRGKEGREVANGNSRALAILLHFGLTGEELAYPTLKVDGDPAKLSFDANAANDAAIKMEWKARTAYAIRFMADRPAGTQAEFQVFANVKRGVAQLSWNSAEAVTKHSLDLARCVGLDAAEWRKVRDLPVGDVSVEALAYGEAPRIKAFSPKQVIETLASRGNVLATKLVAAMEANDADAFALALA